MKKWFVVLVSAILALVCLAAASAETHAPGDTVNVKISITTDGAYASVGFTFDKDALEFVSASGGAVAPQSASGNFIFGSGTTAIGSAEGTITFKVKTTAKPGSYEVKPVVKECYDISENDTSATVKGETIKVECPHTDFEWQVTKEATCTEKGAEAKVCKICGEDLGETRDINPLGHDKGSWGTTLDPSCTEKGKEELQCTRCHEKLDERDIEALGHAGSEWTVVLKPTCTEKGKEELQCTRCHEKYDERDIEPLGHNYDKWTVVEKPTCTEKGKEELCCTRCGLKNDERDVEPHGHDKGKWVIIQKPTATEDGIKQLQCTRCGFTLDEVKFKEEIRYNQTVCSQGIRFRDINSEMTDKWFMFTPIDISKDGEYTLPLIAANLYEIGTVTVTVKDGKLTLEYAVCTAVELKDLAFTLFDGFDSVTTVDMNELNTYEFGQEISIADDLNGSNMVLLYVLGHADCDVLNEQLNYMNKNTYQASVEPLMEMLK